ncbi:hypothetical protein CERZMDRAFT_94649 [Cercospora zeae-maydis SCOH1-5]|uniref:2EXR domain-containing protein n=1 Tax=Cercospora zeae-maydis SCOH1-5 TaxID=717836 RepID=A0A6A6FPL7_9PEZI|nr:hypothetical protein CERZMDRAFT_94649 [Cercospora zeae-maydis SCOH1-5]
MWDRFRRSSKTARPPTSDCDSRQTSVATHKAQRTTTFFDLPAELRNQIYELAASDTTLHLCTKPNKPNKPSKQKHQRMPSLLLTSRQCRAEYLPILLATAPISTLVKNFDFSNIIRMTGSLYNTELKALRSNPNLTILLTFSQTSRTRTTPHAMEASLRSWITYRSAGMDRLRWHYALPMQDRMPRVSGHVKFMLEYTKCLDVLKGLLGKVDEGLQWELQMMLGEVEQQDRVSVGHWMEQYIMYSARDSNGEQRVVQ